MRSTRYALSPTRINKAKDKLYRLSDGGRLFIEVIRARRAQTYEVETLSLMLTSEHWIPVEGVHELPLIQALVAQQRRFVKPLRYDAKSVSEFANALLLDAGPAAMPLHLLSPFMTLAERAAKERAISATIPVAWVWCLEDVMPLLPALLTPISG